MHELAQALFDSLSSLGPEIAVLIVSMCPFVELRLAIPIGCIAGLPVWERYCSPYHLLRMRCISSPVQNLP